MNSRLLIARYRQDISKYDAQKNEAKKIPCGVITARDSQSFFRIIQKLYFNEN